MNQKHSSALTVIISLLIILLVAGLAAIIVLGFMHVTQLKESTTKIESELATAKSDLADAHKQNENLRKQLVTVQSETQAQTQERILKEVGAKYTLPQNEKPNFAQVKDVAALKGQDFFKDAQNGDYLVIYPKAKLSILYRPSENKIIQSGQVEVTQQQ